MLNLYILLGILVFIYSYGFVDLNLTLSSQPAIYSLIERLKYIPYFNRPLSTQIYIAIILAFTILYIIALRRLPARLPWKKLALLGLIFSLAYPLLSHDLFKYLFSARMVIDYGANPHTTSPDQMTGDLWLRFLRWTHTPSPYGPTFTLFTIPSYVLGLGKFTLSFYIFKLINFSFYLFSIVLLGQLSKLLDFKQKHTIQNQLLFALNPLILIDLLANSHNDLMMFTLFLLSLKLYFTKEKLKSALILILSAGIKYITVILAPFYFLKISKAKLIDFLALFFLIAPIIYYRQYQPWYITWFVTITALSRNIMLRNLAILFSLSALIKYTPFIYTGLWSASPVEYALLSFSLPILYLIFIWIRPLRLI